MFVSIDGINNRRSLWLGAFVLGPFLFLASMFLMWMQVIEFATKHEYWRILSFGTHYVFTLIALSFLRKCYLRLRHIKSIS